MKPTATRHLLTVGLISVILLILVVYIGYQASTQSTSGLHNTTPILVIPTQRFVSVTPSSTSDQSKLTDAQWKQLVGFVQYEGQIIIEVTLNSPALDTLNATPIDANNAESQQKYWSIVSNLSEEARAQLLDDLKGYHYTIIHEPENAPRIVLRVDESTLYYLMVLPLVKTISYYEVSENQGN